MDENTMYIHLFDGFTIDYNGVFLNMREYLSKQALHLLEVLVLQSNGYVSRDSLMELFWDNSDNPLSSLKFNIFRLRKLLKGIPSLSHVEMIQTEKGGYRFTPNVPAVIDTVLFETDYEKIMKVETYGEKEAVYARNMLDLYEGSLYHDADQLWFIQKSEYFRNIFLEIAAKLCEYYLQNNLCGELKNVALKAATLEPSVEEHHFYYIQAMIREGDYASAFEYYQKSTRMLVSEYAVSLSDRMKDLYTSIVNNNEEKRNMEGITSYYQNKQISSGAFYCDNTAFDYIYEISIRNALREQINYFLFIFEISCDDERRLDALQLKAKDSI